MALISTGRSAAATLPTLGQAATGLPIEDDLAVSPSTDLAVDATGDLEIGSGVIWAGASAARIIET